MLQSFQIYDRSLMYIFHLRLFCGRLTVHIYFSETRLLSNFILFSLLMFELQDKFLYIYGPKEIEEDTEQSLAQLRKRIQSSNVSTSLATLAAAFEEFGMQERSM